MDKEQHRNNPFGDTNSAQCCGGPAPAGIDACCVRDAEAKAAGKGGCGCSAAGAPDKETTGRCP
jgi:hypothetical protein